MKKQTLKLFTISLIAFVIIISVLLYFFSERFTRSWIPIDHGFGDTVTLSPDDQKIVFPFYQSGDGALYKANLDGTEVVQLTYPRQNESHVHPRYSRSGEKLLFLSQEKTTENLKQSLYIMSRDGNDLMRLSENKELIIDAIFSEDDKKIYYLGAENYNSEGIGPKAGPVNVDLYSISVTGENKERLTKTQSLKKRSLSITEDGKKIGYVQVDEGEEGKTTSNYIVYDKEQKEAKMVKPNNKGVASDLIYSGRISPDGSLIAFSAGSANPRKESQTIYELYTMDINGDKVEPVTSFRTFITEPTFFHQSNRVLFIQDQSWTKGQANFKLWALDLNGERIKSITLQMPQFSGTAL
ncbi:TolB family protein [Sutcliffiella halmapala]